MKENSPLILSEIKLFTLDLDGTIVDSKLDFDLMRSEIGLARNAPILETIEKDFTPKQFSHAMSIIHKHEMKGAEESTLMPGFIEFKNFVDQKGIPIAIQTRNSSEVAAYTLKKFGINVPLILSRDNCSPKPNPEGLIHMMQKYQVQPKQTVYIGDSKYDMQTANNANVFSILFKSSYNEGFKPKSHLCINDFRELIY